MNYTGYPEEYDLEIPRLVQSPFEEWFEQAKEDHDYEYSLICGMGGK